MLLLLLLFSLIGFSCGQQGDNLTDLIDSIFNTSDSRTGDGSGGTTNTTQNSDCECVPYYLCNNNTIIVDGMGLIDIRYKPIATPEVFQKPPQNLIGLLQAECATQHWKNHVILNCPRIQDGPCENYLEYCCQPPDRVPVPITTPRPVENQNRGCGYRNPGGVGFRITGEKDNEAQFGEFPWMVAILREEAVEGNTQKLNVYQCGGALIHPQVVLTAAHCVTGNKQLKIRAGEWDTQTKNELYPHQDRDVKTIIMHPNFYSGALFNDVALLILESPLEMEENVDVVCLPPHNANINNVRCFASGWGKDVFGKEGKYQVILKKIDLPIVPRDPCQTSLRTTRLGKHFKLHESFICAGGEEGKDTCKGDGGSPLVCPISGQKDRYHQVGIVAWGIGCGENQVPGVYANVAKFRDWIDEQMKNLNFDITEYQY